jgi:uncharacterized protein YndB with AHSA1/START domain
MTAIMTAPAAIDPQRDLVLERVVDVAPERVFAAWTRPELMKRWFTPKPWETTAAAIDLRPGGVFSTTMRGPDGTESSGDGCILEVVENRRLVWTSAMGPGYRPLSQAEAAAAPFLFTAVITMEPEGAGTRYRAVAIHSDEAGARAHEQMGFHTGWGMALDQLVELMRNR